MAKAPDDRVIKIRRRLNNKSKVKVVIVIIVGFTVWIPLAGGYNRFGFRLEGSGPSVWV